MTRFGRNRLYFTLLATVMVCAALLPQEVDCVESDCRAEPKQCCSQQQQAASCCSKKQLIRVCDCPLDGQHPNPAPTPTTVKRDSFRPVRCAVCQVTVGTMPSISLDDATRSSHAPRHAPAVLCRWLT